jgi:hypothetical protein
MIEPDDNQELKQLTHQIKLNMDEIERNERNRNEKMTKQQSMIHQIQSNVDQDHFKEDIEKPERTKMLSKIDLRAVETLSPIERQNMKSPSFAAKGSPSNMTKESSEKQQRPHSGDANKSQQNLEAF